VASEIRRYDALTRSAVDAIISADKSGRITDWNPAAQRIFGYSADEAIGQSLEILMPERFRRSHAAGVGRLASGGSARVAGATHELWGIRKSGEEFPIELSLSHWQVDGEVGFTGIIRDISRRRRKEEEFSQMFSLVAEVLEGQAINGRYSIERKLTSDDVSVLYEGTDLEHQVPVAIKILRPPADSRPWTWGDAGTLPVHPVEHDHAIEVLEMGKCDLAFPFVVSEFLSGETLHQRMRRGGQPSLSESLAWLAQTARALAAAHSDGFVHGNIGARSVFLHEPRSGERVVKVVDFGLQQFCESTALRLERPLECGDASGRADDVWGLGALLVELLTGRRPVPEDSPEVWKMWLIDIDADVAHAVWPVVRVALRCDGERRVSAAELADEVLRLSALFANRSQTSLGMPVAKASGSRR